MLGELPTNRPTEEELHEVVQRIETRLVAELPGERAAVLMRAAIILASMRVPKNDLSRVFQGVGLMGEVAAFDYLMEQGAIKASREFLIEQGRTKFGQADQTAEAVLNSIPDIDRLKRMAKAIFRANSWQDLVSTP
jgi:hypothetical protein